LKTDTSFYKQTCLPCHHSYVVASSVLAFRLRLSNIDSIDIPSIANLSRFEHVLGVAHLSTLLALRPTLDRDELLVLDGAALLHDWAIDL